MIPSLEIDNGGLVWLLGESEEPRLLGHVEDAATADLIPPGLLDEFGLLSADWRESVAFGAACKDEARYAFWYAKGAL